MKEFILFMKDIFSSRKLILELSKNDFKVKYAGSYLGIIWAFVQPIITILVFWFVFQVGFKSAPVGDFPFILWLICGMVPWFFFSEAVVNSTNSLTTYSYLVKKVVFKITVLPVVKIISSLYVHIFFVVFIFIMFLSYGYLPSIYNLQVIYYSAAMVVLVFAIGLITSSVVVFFKDISEIVSIIIQFGFWLTPIFWSYKQMPIKYLKLIKLNPMYYIVEGYRDTFINHVWFWQRYNQSIYFWTITLILLVCGALVFEKLRPHFSDVL